jgi:hypothetical protein
MAVPVQPCLWSAHARSRRPSRQSRGERGFAVLMGLVYHARALVYLPTPASVVLVLFGGNDAARLREILDSGLVRKWRGDAGSLEEAFFLTDP